MSHSEKGSILWCLNCFTLSSPPTKFINWTMADSSYWFIKSLDCIAHFKKVFLIAQDGNVLFQVQKQSLNGDSSKGPSEANWAPETTPALVIVTPCLNLHF